MNFSSLRPLTFAAAIVTMLLLSACASPNESTSTAPTTSSVVAQQSSDAPVSSAPLLDAVTSTILNQPLAYPADSTAQVSSSVITLQPGAETGLHRHDAPMYAYILEGELTVDYEGGITKVYKPGQAIMEALETPHNGKNTGKTNVRVLVVNIGADGVANTVKLP